MVVEKKNRLQNVFVSGLLILIPIVATLFILVFLFNLLDSWFSPYGAQILRFMGVALPADWKRIPGFGILATLLLIMLTGVFASNYLGRRLLALLDSLLGTIPLFNSVYKGIRQLVEAFSASKGNAFKTVVLLEFPRKGIWTIGFLTAEGAAWAKRETGADVVNVFIPAAPIPSAGMLMLVPRNELKVLAISVEEAFKMIATIGIVSSVEKLRASVAAPRRASTPRKKKNQRKK